MTINQNSSHIIIFNEQNRVLILKRSANDKWEPNKFAIPGGKKEIGETIKQSIVREVREESNLTIFPNKITYLDKLSRELEHIFFVTNIFKGQVKLTDGEHSEFKWIYPKDINDKESVPNLKKEILEAEKILFKISNKNLVITIKINFNEDYQQTMRKNHPRWKNRLLDAGSKNKDKSSPYKIKPSMQRNKSAPPAG